MLIQTFVYTHECIQTYISLSLMTNCNCEGAALTASYMYSVLICGFLLAIIYIISGLVKLSAILDYNTGICPVQSFLCVSVTSWITYQEPVNWDVNAVLSCGICSQWVVSLSLYCSYKLWDKTFSKGYKMNLFGMRNCNGWGNLGLYII